MTKFKSQFLSRIHHAYYRTDGSYAWPNSREGDMLRQARIEIKSMQDFIVQMQKGMDWKAKAVERLDVAELACELSRAYCEELLQQIDSKTALSNEAKVHELTVEIDRLRKTMSEEAGVPAKYLGIPGYENVLVHQGNVPIRPVGLPHLQLEKFVRFCPECGHIGEVPYGHVNCCPDGSSAARYVPARFAEICKKTLDDFLALQKVNKEKATKSAELEYVADLRVVAATKSAICQRIEAAVRNRPAGTEIGNQINDLYHRLLDEVRSDYEKANNIERKL